MGQLTVLLTGASDGIGLALAQQFQREGARVISIGRRPASQLDPVLQSDYCRVDLAQPFAAAVVTEFLRRRSVTALDLLIHCAGVGSYGSVEAQATDAIDALLATNLRAPIALSHALLPLLVPTKGRIVFIGSVAAALPVPDYAVYGATKAALEGFARSLRVELRGQVGVQVIHPGATRTGMHAKIGAPLERIGWRRFPPPKRVARQMRRAIAGGRPVVTLGLGNRLLRFAGRYLGTAVERIASGRRPALSPQKTLSPQPSALKSPSALGSGSALSLQPSAFMKLHCLVTGGADGIGRAVAERFARAGYQITILDRDGERARLVCQAIQAAGGIATSIVADLAQSDGIAGALHHFAALPPATVVVHSAGISAVGRFAESELTRQQVVLDVNLRAPMLLSAGLLRTGGVAPDATLVYLASLSVFTSYPGAAVYAASKDGLAAYARSLRVALGGRGLNVLTVYPGPTRTAHARRYSPDNRREPRRMAPAQLAELLYTAVMRREPTLIPGGVNRLIAALGRLAPTLTEELMRRTILAKLPDKEPQ